VRVFGKTRAVEHLDTQDFAELRRDISKSRNPESLGNEINRVRGVFKFANENGLIDKPVRYGSDFKRPSRRVLRKVRNAREQKFFEAEEIRLMLGSANVQLKAMILLACNGGLGNADIANLPISALDLRAGWCAFPRVKTGIDRRFPLWPETVAAIQDWLKVRPKPKDQRAHGHLLFVTAKTRTTWSKDERVRTDEGDLGQLARACQKSSDNPISKEMRKLLNSLDIKRRGVSFYALRHVFETVGGEAKDQVAVNAVMGHADESMAGQYREYIADERLEAVVEHVRKWLFGADNYR
jgi:integrase